MTERLRFEYWLRTVHGLEGTWDEDRNCYKEFACHLAYKAWLASQHCQR